MTILLGSAALGAALVGGIFFAFSTFVMRALGNLAPANGIKAMQSINVVVLNPLFFLAFFGTGVLCVAAIVVSLRIGSGTLRLAALGGGLSYLFGCLFVTMAGNVPLNERLAKADPSGVAANDLWRLYLVRWTRWNHVRTAASLAAAAAFGTALAMA